MSELNRAGGGSGPVVNGSFGNNIIATGGQKVLFRYGFS